ncbi:MAG: hypothetical protein ACL93V_12995 [Candidatus Electrothrix sp. YB6]
MYFDFNELTKFTLGSDGRTVQCVAQFLKPVHIVMMSILHHYTDCSATFLYHADYAKVMRFDDPLEIDTVDGSNHSKAIKLKNKFDNDKQVKKIMTILEGNNYLDNETNSILELVISEVFQNFYAHADTDKPPICCVQDWSTSDFMEISIADNGIGIGNALGAALKNYSDNSNPCRIACDLGVSSCLYGKGKLGTSHSGYGLYYTKRFIEENKGILFLFSGNTCYINKDGVENDRTLPYSWKGTVIRLIINKKYTLPSKYFFEKIGKEIDGDDYEEFF